MVELFMRKHGVKTAVGILYAEANQLLVWLRGNIQKQVMDINIMIFQWSGLANTGESLGR